MLRRASFLIFGIAVAIPAGVSGTLFAQAPKPSAWSPATLGSGRVLGYVRDNGGRAVAGAMIAAVGNASSTRAAVSDATGRFDLALPAGEYVLRTHRDGYGSARDLVMVAASSATERNITLVKEGAAHAALVSTTTSTSVPAHDPQSASADADYPHDETAWQLRHLPRSVLHDNGYGVAVLPADDGTSTVQPWSPWLDRTSGNSAHTTSGFLSNTDFTGQVNLLTTGAIGDGRSSSSDIGRSIAYVTVGAPLSDRGDWTIRGAVTSGDAASWIMLGEYRAKADQPHAFVIGLSYSTVSSLEADPVADVAAVSNSAGVRRAGAVYGSDRWQATRRRAVDYGVRLDRYDDVSSSQLVSSHAGLRFLVLPQTFVTLSGARQVEVPGAEELSLPVAGMWLPSGGSLMSLDSTALQVERIRDGDIGIEHRFGSRSVSVRRFYQSTDHQLATLYGIDPALAGAGQPGDYFIAAAGPVDVDGWGARVSGSIAPRITGAVDYSMADARWGESPNAALLAVLAPSVGRSAERVHDVTTSLEASLPGTATRLSVLYRVSNVFSHGADGPAMPSLSGRFDLQLSQSLPFTTSRGSQWDLLVAVRNFCHDPRQPGSIYDELLTVAPPTRVLAGVRVRF